MISIAFDSHKRYTFASVCDENLEIRMECRIDHQRGALKQFLKRWPKGTVVAVETIGNWYWIIDEIEAAGMKPALVHARRAKLMSGAVHKTDRLDARAINRLSFAGTLPTVWIAPAEVRDRRELLRTRIVLSGQRTALKNRIHSVLDKYALNRLGFSDIFCKRGVAEIESQLSALPEQTRFCTGELLEELRDVQSRIDELDSRIAPAFESVLSRSLLLSLPGVGPLLSAVIASEVGEVKRFPSAAHLAAYSGTVPRTHASGGKVRHLRSSPEVNRYLKWAYSEAANVVALGWRRRGERYVDYLYRKLRMRKGHSIAVGAVSRHLAESSWHMMSRDEMYRERGFVSRRQV
jgi:transposase